jgi:hypothetical protein
MKTKTTIVFEPGEKEQLIQLMTENESKSSLEKQTLIKEKFNVSMGIATIVVNRYNEIVK